MGDVNHGNCVVLADGTVKLIDCDSYSVKTDKMRYACEVGVATHLAPELQGANLSEVEREDKHDNFGLAVIIFQLLFLGRHPFAGNYLGAEDKSIEECIRELRFAYGDGAEHRKVKQPPGTLSLSAVSPRIALMFERAFLTEDRPEPREWIEALGDLEENLEQCGLHPGHFYFNELAHCPWCEIEAQTGLMLFPFVTNSKHADGEKPFNIFTVENLIASFGINENLPAKPLLPIFLPPPLPEVIEAKKESRKQLVVSIGVQFFGLIFLMMIFGVGIAFVAGVCAMIFWMVYLKASCNFNRDDIINELSIMREEWDRFEEKWQQKALPQSLDNDLASVRKKVADYQKFQQERLREAKAFEGVLIQREMFRHLRSISLDEAEIDGITPEQKQLLVGSGVVTAAEVSENKIRLFRDFNGEVVPKLLEWRNKIELEFVAAPHSTIFKNEHEEFARETACERRRIEMEIEHLLTILRSGAVNLRRRQQELGEKSANLGNRFLQAESNAEALGSNSPAIVVLVLITILTPYFGFIVSQINAPRTNYSSSPGISGYSSGSGGGIYSGKSAKLNNLDENITDQEISMLSDSQRTVYAEGLLMQTSQMSYGRPDYERDEQKMRLAIRLKENDTRFLNQLGYALYEQQKYDESLKYLNRSLSIEKDNSGTKVFIAINYLRVKRFKDARAILTEVVEKYPTHFEGFYNLGLAETGLKNYAAAAKALQKAVNINPDDADANYELGINYYKLGDKIKVEEQYEKLLDLDQSRAADFWDEAKIAPQERIITRSSDEPPAKIGIK